MEDREYIIILYDYYGELLSDSHREIFEEYYFNNLSLGEISDIYEKSRNAIHKSIKFSESKLLEYEDKLKLYEKNKKMLLLIKEVSDDDLRSKMEELV